jgi:predicted  nucleic acid-binding Zn-ribbon protein
MAQKTEKLEQDVLDKILKAQNEANQLIFELGQISLRNRELDAEIAGLKKIKTDMEDKFDNLSLQLENTLSDLRRKYPNGEVDLQEGVVIFETPE